MNGNRDPRTTVFKTSDRWGIFVLSFVVLFIVTGLLAGVVTKIGMSQRDAVLVTNILQGVLAFSLPTILAWKLTDPHPWHSTGISYPFSGKAFLWMAAIYVASYPLIAQTVYWNDHLTLPDSMNGLETMMRQMEDTAAQTTNEILSATSVGSLIVNVLIVGVFTGIVEELFFRAGLQRMMIASGMRAGIAIFLAAFIFSALHFQFFGFVPRLLLGALFGYVYYRTGSIWASATLHAINNSLVIIQEWLSQNGLVNIDLENDLVNPSGIPWYFLGSLVITVLLIWFTRNTNFRNRHGSFN